jgi:MFS transporter, DHA2 family, multidrug resistance protein
MLISDPPYMKQKKNRTFRVDFVGLGLLALGLGALQVVLDKGQRDDWFGSHFIVIMTAICVVALIAVGFWEWHHENPIIDLHLFKDRSFAVGNMMMFMVGFALLSSTVLIPQFVQDLLGYTAERAGLALMPGGLAIIMCMPLVGYLLGHTDARKLLFFGFTVLALALFHMTGFDTAIDFRSVATARVFQAMGLAFLFVPINTVSYAFLPPGKNNAASGLINLARNVGGSVGISLVITMLARRTQVHQSNLTHNLTAGSGQYQAMINGATRVLEAHGSSATEAARQAQGLVASTLNQQATMLAYIDNFWMLGIAVSCMIPLVFLMKKAKTGGPMAVH